MPRVPSPRNVRVRTRTTPTWVGALLLGAMLVLGAGASEGAAQAVRGTVVDQYDRRPIEGARIEVRDTEGDVLARMLTDAAGRFLLGFEGGTGPFSFEASALGYQEWVLPAFRVPAGDTLQLVEVTLEPRPFLLDTLMVQRRRGSIMGVTPGWVKIQRRQAEETGVFLSGAMIAAANPPSLTQYLSDVQGLAQGAGDDALGDNTELTSTEGRRCMKTRVNEWLTPSAAFIDSLDDLEYSAIAAIEIYTSYADVPDDLAFWAFPCGVVNIWLWSAYCGSAGCPGQRPPGGEEGDPYLPEREP